MATKPTYKPELATTDITLPEAGTGNKIRPSEVTREVGYDFRQYLPAQEYNYQWHLTNQWINYFEEVTDDIGVTEVATQEEAETGEDNSKIMTPLRNRQFASQYGLGNTPSQAADLEEPSLDSLTTSGEFSVVDATGGPTSLGGSVTGILKVSTRPFTEGGGDQTVCHQTLLVSEDNISFERFQDQTDSWSSWGMIKHKVGDGLTESTSNGRMSLGEPSSISFNTVNEVTEEGHTHELDASSIFTGSLNQNGYVEMPNGLIIQWGYYSGGSNSPTVNYPISFPNSVFSVTATATGDYGSCAVRNVTDSSFIGDQTGINDQERDARSFYWMAIGR